MPGKKKQIKNVVVFCGSKNGNDPIYREHAEKLGRLLAEAGYKIIYGGGNCGLMGAVSGAAVRAGGKVKGIITHSFQKASWYEMSPGVEEEAVSTLRNRKARMMRQADAVVVLPGGVGTLDEQWEIAALLDMEICARSRSFLKPIVVLSTSGYFDHMKGQMKRAINDGFTQPGRETLIKSVSQPEEVMAKLQACNEQGLKRACDLAPVPA
jgi:uncharacterized protein (TIGR00730 family)